MTQWSEEFYPWKPALHKLKTMHLTAEQDGIYRRLIDHYMEMGQPLPDNDYALACISRVAEDTWNKNSDVIKSFFKKTKKGSLKHTRCDLEISTRNFLREKYSKKGKLGAKARWKNDVDNQEEKCPSHASGNAHAMPENGTKTETKEVSKEESKKDKKVSKTSDVDDEKIQANPPPETLPPDEHIDDRENPFTAERISYLTTSTEKDERSMRAMIGMWRKNHTLAEIATAIDQAQENGAQKPIPYIRAILRAEPRVEHEDGVARSRAAI